jgi:hypothetical protein
MARQRHMVCQCHGTPFGTRKSQKKLPANIRFAGNFIMILGKV